MQPAVPLWKVIVDFGRQDYSRARKGPVFSWIGVFEVAMFYAPR
jgi:hypothetical protein